MTVSLFRGFGNTSPTSLWKRISSTTGGFGPVWASAIWVTRMCQCKCNWSFSASEQWILVPIGSVKFWTICVNSICFPRIGWLSLFQCFRNTTSEGTESFCQISGWMFEAFLSFSTGHLPCLVSCTGAWLVWWLLWLRAPPWRSAANYTTFSCVAPSPTQHCSQSPFNSSSDAEIPLIDIKVNRLKMLKMYMAQLLPKTISLNLTLWLHLCFSFV